MTAIGKGTAPAAERVGKRRTAQAQASTRTRAFSGAGALTRQA